MLTTSFIVLSSVCHADDVDDYFQQAEQFWKEQIEWKERLYQSNDAMGSADAVKELKKEGPWRSDLRYRTGSIGFYLGKARVIQITGKDSAIIELELLNNLNGLDALFDDYFTTYTVILKGGKDIDLSNVADGDNITRCQVSIATLRREARTSLGVR